MTDQTPLDAAHAAMTNASDDDALRMAFYAKFADTEIVLLLASEAGEDTVTPALVESGGARYVTVFDSEDRLAGFAGRVAPYAGLSGRGLAEMLAGQGIGIALNPDVAPSSMLIPPEAIDWLTRTLAHAPQVTSARPVSVAAPGELPRGLVEGLERKLSGTAALAEAAWLCAVTYDTGGLGHLLAFVGAIQDAEAPLAVAANEALTFSGIDAGEMDVTFVESGSTLAQRIERVGQPVTMSVQAVDRPIAPGAPGLDPERPPKLR